MRITDGIGDIRLGQAAKGLKGHARLDLMRGGKVVHRVEHDNAVTNYIADAIGKGNYLNTIPASKIYPLKQWFSGCYLTDVANDPDLGFLAANATIVAQANSTAYSGDNPARGSMNTTESGEITGGYRFVWDWGTDRGNGTITSVCLTRDTLGGAWMIPASEGILPTSDTDAAMEYAGYINSASVGTAKLIYDYDGEKGYEISYDSGTVTVTEYPVNTWRVKLIGDYFNTPSSLRQSDTITHTISVTLTYGTETARRCASIVDGTLVLLGWSDNANPTTMQEVVIDTASWEVTKNVTHSYAVNVDPLYGYRDYYWRQNGDVITSDYIYANDRATNSLIRLSRTSDADITEYSDDTTITTDLSTGWISPNGDINLPVAWLDNTWGMYWKVLHNGEVYYCRRSSLNTVDGSPISNLDTGHGTFIQGCSYRADYPRNQSLCFPGFYVSTVANLDAAVTKPSDLTMKLTYDITES